jgi:hypothetical protein
MAKWQYRLELADLWDAFENNTMTINQIGKEISNRIQKANFYSEYESELFSITVDFEDVETTDGFDDVLEQLYDWADQSLPTPSGEMQRKLCWINTMRI